MVAPATVVPADAGSSLSCSSSPGDPSPRAPNAPASPDLLFSGEGDAFRDAADARGAADAVYCEPGADLVEADAGDFVAGSCEEAVRF